MKAIEIIMIPVKDRKKSKKFYEKIGLTTLVEGPDMHGAQWIQLGFPGQSTTLSLAEFPAIIYTVDDIEMEIAVLKGKDVEVGKADTTPYGKFAWFKDPDGNGICLREAPKEGKK